MKGYLLEIAEQKAKEITNGFATIKTTLNKDFHSLGSYVDYVSQLKKCTAEKDNLFDLKKKLEDMNNALRRFRSKDESDFSSKQQVLQSKLEKITGEIQDIDDLIKNKTGNANENRDKNVELLDEELNKEK